MLRSGLALVAFAALLVSRHPAILTNANFWAEDGAIWFPEARALGFASLAQPSTGYLQATSRTVALLAQSLPVAQAPLGFALVALLIQALPPTFLVSDRLRAAWPDRRTRVLAALAYVALPNATEVFVNVTNAHWHLAVLAFLILLADPPSSRKGCCFDAGALLLASLSGPFCILLAPVAVWEAAARPTRAAVGRLGLVMVGAVLQLALLRHMGHSRTTAPLDATPGLFVRILGLQVVLGPLLGPRALGSVLAWPAWRSGLVPLAAFLSAGGVGLYALAAGPPILRKFCLFAALVLGASLLYPMVDTSRPQWPLMPVPLAAQRYWFIPMLAWVGLVVALLGARPLIARGLGAGLLGVVLWHVPTEWRYWPYGDPPGFAAAAARFEAALPGTPVRFPIRPDGWHMTLVR